MQSSNAKRDECHAFPGKTYDVPGQKIKSILEEKQSLKNLGFPYWYLDYIQAKRLQQSRSNTPSSGVKSARENSDFELDVAEKNITHSPTSSDVQSPNECSNGDTLNKSRQVKCNQTPPIKNAREDCSKNNDLPEIIIPIRRANSFPRLSCCRKVENINIVLPPKPSPLNIDVIDKKSETMSDESNNYLPNYKQTFPEATDDSLFYGTKNTFQGTYISKDLNGQSKLPAVFEQSMSSYGNMSSTINSMTSDFDFHICNILATSTPLSSSHALNVLVQEKRERRQTSRWVAKLRTLIHNVDDQNKPAKIDRRKSQPPPIKDFIKGSKDTTPQNLSSSTSKFSTFMKLFRKISPKKSKNKQNTSVRFSQKGFLPIPKKRFSLDPQTIRKWNDKHVDKYRI